MIFFFYLLWNIINVFDPEHDRRVEVPFLNFPVWGFKDQLPDMG